MKVNTWEADADIKESGLFSGASHLEDGRLTSQSLSPHLSGGRGFYKEVGGGGAEQSDQGKGLKSSLGVDEHSPFW